MSYRALYRVFRPQTFAEVRGQDHISTTLKNAILTERLAHAYLFCGPRGTGKTSSAKILAKAVNCLDLQNGEPCNQCANCRAINEENFLDVLEIDAASNRGIDEIRDLRDKVRFAPSQGKRKVYIIDEVHMLTNEAFNALLKTLEEPPAHVLFILATTEPQKIPLTILSRCQRFDFRKINTEEIRDHLAEIVREEQVEIADDALNAIARKAAGGMRDAISVLDQCIAFAGSRIELEHVELVLGTISEEDTAALMDAVIQQAYGQLFTLLHDFVQRGKDVKQILRDCIQYCRQLLLLKVAPKEQLIELSLDSLGKAKEQANALPVEFLGRMINRLAAAEKDLRYSNQPQILLEAALVDLMIQGTEPVAAVQAVSTAKDTPATRRAPQKEQTTAAQAQPVRKLIASDELLQQWAEVMNVIKGKSVKLHAFLAEAKPAALQNGELILRFQYQFKFHYNTVSQDENLRMIAQAVQQLTGQPVKVAVELENEAGHIKQELTLVEEARKLFGDVPIELKD